MKSKSLLKYIPLFLPFLVTAIIVGCGGGDDVLTGVFVDGPVSGLRYSTATQSGEMNTDGEFLYQAGETVSFYVGDILIGQAMGASTISPFDLAGISPPQSGAAIRLSFNQLDNLVYATPLEIAANIAVFLQTLDDDGDLTNGIQVPAHTLYHFESSL